MTMRCKLFLFVLLLTTLSAAQTTAVTANVQDPTGQVYAGGTWQFQFHPNGFDPSVYLLNGSPFTQKFAGSLDNLGTFTANIPDNSQITPAGSQWDFQVCAAASIPCTTVVVGVSGTTQDLSSAINSRLQPISITLDPQPTAKPFARAYQDAEIANPIYGILYFNLTDACLHWFDGAAWNTICAGGGGGGGASFSCPLAVNGALVYAVDITHLNCDPNSLTDALGHLLSQSYQAVGAGNGIVELTGGSTDPTTPPDNNSVAWLAAASVASPYYIKPPASLGIIGQTLTLQNQTTGVFGTIDFLDWQTSALTPPLFQTNTVNNASQTGLNLLNSVATNGITLTMTNTSGVNDQLGITGTLNNSGLTNSSIIVNTASPLGGGATVALGGTLNLTCTGCLTTVTQQLPCESGIGDGANAVPAATYLQTFCYNMTGKTFTITNIRCFTDNNGTSTLNATNGASTGLLTGAITCTNTWAAGTQSGTTTIAAGDWIKFTFVADGISKQTSWAVGGTIPLP